MRLAVYAGTFDPVTLGHLSVVERGAALFDQLFVLVAVNPSKRPLFSAEERVEMLRDACARYVNVECAYTPGYVVDFARARGVRYLIRGVRSSTDVEGEIALANLNRELAPEIETVFVPAHPELSEVSSSRLKELARSGGDVLRYCPPEVALRLRERAGELGFEEGSAEARNG
jgi:pantetheine-phosphate adenylyltransferase